MSSTRLTAMRPAWLIKQSFRPVTRVQTFATHVQESSLGKREGDISSVFASLSNVSRPLPTRFSDVKRDIISSRGDKITASFHRLLKTIAAEVLDIKTLGSAAIPSINFADLPVASDSFKNAHRQTGLAIVRGVVPENQAKKWLQNVKEYIKINPQTKAFPKDNPAVYELYWSQAQLEARSHPNMIETMRCLMQFWHSSDPRSLISTNQPITYCDRLRIRPPGDAAFALGPHIDGGGVERWEKEGYGGINGTYGDVFRGDWEKFDGFDASPRLSARSDLYQGAGACSAFRMYQGWLSLSNTGPEEGTLKVNPLFSRATAYVLLRPFFQPKNADPDAPEFLIPQNWVLEDESTPVLQGASIGHAQELTAALHPHLDLEITMVSLPRVKPGDYIAWHCDSIHAVDAVHKGLDHSSVMYIPTCPLTIGNIEYLSKQRDAFLQGIPPPDFPGGEGESSHIGRPGKDIFDKSGIISQSGGSAMGMKPFHTFGGKTLGEKTILAEANRILSL